MLPVVHHTREQPPTDRIGRRSKQAALPGLGVPVRSEAQASSSSQDHGHRARSVSVDMEPSTLPLAAVQELLSFAALHANYDHRDSVVRGARDLVIDRRGVAAVVHGGLPVRPAFHDEPAPLFSKDLSGQYSLLSPPPKRLRKLKRAAAPASDNPTRRTSQPEATSSLAPAALEETPLALPPAPPLALPRRAEPKQVASLPTKADREKDRVIAEKDAEIQRLREQLAAQQQARVVPPSQRGNELPQRGAGAPRTVNRGGSASASQHPAELEARQLGLRSDVASAAVPAAVPAAVQRAPPPPSSHAAPPMHAADVIRVCHEVLYAKVRLEEDRRLENKRREAARLPPLAHGSGAGGAEGAEEPSGLLALARAYVDPRQVVPPAVKVRGGLGGLRTACEACRPHPAVLLMQRALRWCEPSPPVGPLYPAAAVPWPLAQLTAAWLFLDWLLPAHERLYPPETSASKKKDKKEKGKPPPLPPRLLLSFHDVPKILAGFERRRLFGHVGTEAEVATPLLLEAAANLIETDRSERPVVDVEELLLYWMEIWGVWDLKAFLALPKHKELPPRERVRLRRSFDRLSLEEETERPPLVVKLNQ